MSKKRNIRKAKGCQYSCTGVKKSTRRKATVSSHTMPPWSGLPSARPVTPHAQTPIAKSAASAAKYSGAPSLGPASQKIGSARSVPKVPGATGARPAPAPKAMKCAGWRSTNRAEGACPPARPSAEMVEPLTLQPERIADRVEHCDAWTAAAAAHDLTDQHDFGARGRGGAHDCRAAAPRSGETQLVVVAPCEDRADCHSRHLRLRAHERRRGYRFPVQHRSDFRALADMR